MSIMRNFILIICFLLMGQAIAQVKSTTAKEINIEEFCGGSKVTISGINYKVEDKGFCNA